MSQELLSLQDAAAVMGVSVDTIRRKIKSGTLPAYRFGDTDKHPLRIKRTDLMALLIKVTK